MEESLRPRSAMEVSLLEALKHSVGWSDEDERLLRALRDSPRLCRVAAAVSAAILSHEGAKQALSGGEDQVDDFKNSMRRWLDQVLGGPWDEAYYQSRCREGRWLVRTGLPQHHLLGVMNEARRELISVVAETYPGRPARLMAMWLAVDRIVDLNLAIMLRIYREDLDRLAVVGQLVGCIGHDLRNPLGVIQTSVFVLRKHVGEDARTMKHLDRIDEQLETANNVITDLLDIIRNKPLLKVRVNLDAIIEDVAGAISRPESVILTSVGMADIEVDGNPVQLRRAFLNLLTNAAQAAYPAGEVRVHGSRVKDEVVIAVEDTGPGVAKAKAYRLFEPLTTTKDNGVGLGLPLVKRIVDRHGGTVAYEPRTGGGARFTVRLPAPTPNALADRTCPPIEPDPLPLG